MTAGELREKYLKFFEDKGHKIIEPAKLVLEGDQTTLFTGSGMQPLIPYLMGDKHPAGNRLVNSQPCLRAEDINEVGDNRHTTFFEMLGNWSLGDYSKKEQLEWFYEFLIKELGLDEKRLHVTFFEGNDFIPTDEETFNIWKDLGISEDRIYPYGVDKNWWSRSGSPDKMPEGEIGGTDSEVFYEFPQMSHDKKYGDKCHPHCDCGYFMEIGNSVFIEYKKNENGKFEKLPNKNVDFGGGLERLTAAVNNDPDIFKTDLFSGARKTLAEVDIVNSDKSKVGIRIVLDHIRAAIFIIDSGIEPSNKEQGYVLRRLIRRAALYAKIANIHLLQEGVLTLVVSEFIKAYADFYPSVLKNKGQINNILDEELNKFERTLEIGMKKILSRKSNIPISGSEAFDFYQTYGFPPELIREFADVDMEGFGEAMKHHREQSRTASMGMFKGGLVDQSEVVIKYHTATHLLHQALRDVLGPQVFQQGSNITTERLRFDFSFDRKMSDEEIKQVEDLVNQKIKEDLKVERKFMTVEEAKKLGAIGLFNEKYGDQVSIYMIGPDYKLDPEAKDQRDRDGYYSMEFCGGPHVEHTGLIGKIKITKEEAISAGTRRIRVELVD